MNDRFSVLCTSDNNEFMRISNCFIGLKANLFAYSPGFRELYLSFVRENRYFLFKFVDTIQVKTEVEWCFQGFMIKFEDGIYKISDHDIFNIYCKNFLTLELMNGVEVLEY